jgi:hypothetical protein
MNEPKPEADAAEQQRPALRDDLAEDERLLHVEVDEDAIEPLADSDAETLEADPADVADQRRLARLREDEEPWL